MLVCYKKAGEWISQYPPAFLSFKVKILPNLNQDLKQPHMKTTEDLGCCCKYLMNHTQYIDHVWDAKINNHYLIYEGKLVAYTALLKTMLQ